MADEKKVVLLEIDINVESAIESNNKLVGEIIGLEKEVRQLEETEGKMSAAYTKRNAELKNAKAELAANEKAIQKVTAANNTQLGTLKRLKAENSALASERDNLNLSTEEGAKRLTEINAKIDENNELLKQSSDKTSKAKQNVGNYEESIKNALGSMDAFKGGQGDIINNFISISQQEGGVKSFFGTMVSGIGSATKAGLAFIATPIGAVIFAIVAAIGIFTTAIKNNDEAGEEFGKTWAGVTAVFDVVIGRIIKLYKAMFALYTLDFKGAAQNFSEAFGGISDAVEKAYNSAQKLYVMQLQLDSLRTKSISGLADLAAKEKELALIADDSTRSLQERLNATLELQKVQEQSARINENLALKELQIEAAKFRAAKENQINVKEARKTFLEVEAKYKEAVSETTSIIEENSKKRREIRKDQLNRELDLLIDGFDAVKTVNEKIIANENETFKAREEKLKETRRLSDESFAAQIKAIEKTYGKQIDEDKLLAETDARRLNRMVTEMNLADDISGRVLEIFKERKMALSDLAEAEVALSASKAKASVENLEFETEMFKLNNQSKLENAKVVTEELVNEEINRLREINNKELAENETKFAAKLIKENEYELKKKELQVSFAQETASLLFDFEESERSRRINAAKADYDNQLLLAQDNLFAQFDLKSDELARQTELELANAEALGQDKTLIYEKWAKQEEAIERAKTDAKLSLAAGFAANLKTIAGEGTAIGKAAAVAETTINTYKAATGAYASLASIPYVGPALGAAAAAAAVVAGLANVKKILSVQNPNGGDKVTASPGGGGVSVPRASYNPEIGKGLVSRDNATGTQSSVASGVQQGMNAAPVQPVLVVDTVTAKQNTATNIVQVATY